MTMTREITIIREGWLVRASIAIARWGRRRSIRADLSDVYFGEDHERRASLEEQLLLNRERQAAVRDLDRITSSRALYRGF